MIVVHILTKNNSKTIVRTLESIQALKPLVLVGDLGSSDRTLDICDNYGVQIVEMGDVPRDQARNRLIDQAPNGMNMMIEPWEILSSGHLDVQNTTGAAYVKVLNQTTINKELRLWYHGAFVNPVFERMDLQTDQETNSIFYCIGGRDCQEDLRLIEKWKTDDPLAQAPHYYEACSLMALGEYERFLKSAQHYLFLDKKSMSSVMLRYYLAICYLTHFRDYKSSLQNINLCLCSNPLMAEFWCLMGDVYYHRLKKFADATEFYENAMILGKRRLVSDKWPMDISKYNKYPKKMIDSCSKIVKMSSAYSIIK